MTTEVQEAKEEWRMMLKKSFDLQQEKADELRRMQTELFGPL